MTEFSSHPVRKCQSFLKLFICTLAENWVILFIPTLALAFNTFLLAGLPHKDLEPVFDVFVDIAASIVPLGIGTVVVARFFQHSLVNKASSPLNALICDMKEFFVQPTGLLNGVIAILAVSLIYKVNLDLRQHIPSLNPFKWDETFMHLDRALHFGIDPWRLLQPLMGHGFITVMANLLYNFWFIGLFGSLAWFSFQRRSNEMRTRFFVAFFLTWWIAGGLLAVYFSSAGPAFYGRMGFSPDPYAPLLDYLRDVDAHLPLWSISTQDLLWNGYIGKSMAIGISAFPSMHNANAILLALAFWRVNRFLGWFFLTFAVIIFLSSVHLAWHYAIDGYAAAILVACIWWLAGRIARWVQAHPLTNARPAPAPAMAS